VSGSAQHIAHASLVAALAAAQGEMRAADLDRTNPAFKSRYATLASVMDAIRAPLARHGLAITHTLASQPGGVVVGTALLFGEERLGTEILMPLPQNATPQAVGSAITYGRRYGVSALLAVVADDDDDGEAVSAPMREAGRQARRAEPPAPAPAKPAPAPAKAPATPAPTATEPKPATAAKPSATWPAHVMALVEEAKRLGLAKADVEQAAREVGVQARVLTPEQCVEIVALWRLHAAERAR
jgi:hypothetical protein